MRKWLVGLLAAGLCLSSAWADTVTYTVESTSAVSVSGTAPEGASAEYASTYGTKCQLTKDNSMTLTLKGFEGATITGLTLSMKSNKGGGAGSLSATCGDAVIAAIADAPFSDGSWNGAFSGDYVDVKPSVTETAVTGDIVITIAATANSLYCQSFTIEYEAGEPEFSVTFNKENWFKVALGEASSVTAIPKHGVEPYTFLWDSDTPELKGGTTDTLEIPATLAEGDYTVACLVTDDGGDAINALIGFTVEAIPVITGDNFELVSSSDELQNGMRVLVTDVSHAFAMSSVATGSALASVDVTETDGVITASDESIIWTLVEDSDGNFALQNGEQYVGWPSGNAAKMQADPFANKISVAEGVATITAASDTTRNLKYNKSSPRFAYYTSAQTDLALFKEAGEAGLSVTLDKANGFTVDLGTADSITATAKNGAEPYTYEWTSDTPDLNGTGETLAIPATLAEGDYTVQVEVTDAESNKASKQIYFSVVAPAVTYAVNVAIGILNGGVTADKEQAEEGELVTLTSSPDAGYKLGTFLLDGEAIEGNSFNMPAHDVLVSAEFIVKPVVAGFTKITSLDELTEGEYVLVGSDTNGAYGAVAELTGSTKVLSAAAVTIEDDTVVDAEESQIWTLAQVEGGWTIYNETLGFLGYSGSQNSAMAEAEASEKSTWTFSVAEGELFKVANVGTEGRTLRYNYNKGNMRFACYTSDTLPNIGLYKGSSGPAVPSVSLSASATEVEVNEPVTITATAKNFSADVEWAWEGNDGGSADGAVYTVKTAVAGEFTIKATATAGDEIAEKSVTITVSEPAQKYAVNVAIGILNGGVTADKEQAEEGELVTLTGSPAAGYKLGTFLVDGEAITGNTFNMPAHDVLVSAEFIVKPVVAGFTKITSLDELTEGEYVLVGSDTNGAYGAVAELTGSTKVLSAAAVTIEDDTVVDAEESQIWTLAQVEGGWTIYNETLGFLGYSGSQNSAMAEAEASEKSTWTFSVAEGELFKVANVGTEGRTLRYNYNKGNMRFACYTSDTLPNIGLYKGSSSPAVPSVSLSASATEVEVGGELTITATAKNFSSDVEWAWEGNDGGSADGAVYTVNTAVAGEFTIKATATAGDEIAQKSVTITVNEPAVKYAVTVEQAAGGTIAVDKPEAEAGETVTVTTTADDGMRLVAITVNGSPIEGNSFEMPAEPVTVSATFEEFEVPPYYFQFESNDLPTGYSATSADVTNTGSTAAEVATVPFTLQRVARGNADGDKKVGATAMRLAPIGETNAFAYNSAAFSEAITAISFQYGIYGTSDKCDSFTVSTSEDGEEWTVLADLTATATSGLQTFESSDLPDNTLYIRFDAANTVAGNTRRMDIDEIQLWTGAPRPKIVYSGETTIALGGKFEIIFGLLNYDGDFQWEVASREGGTIAQEGRDGLYTWTPTEATGDEGVTIKVVALSGELEIASKEVVLTVTGPGPQPGEPAIVIDGPASGVVGEALSCQVSTINMQNPTVEFEGNYGKPDGSSLAGVDIQFDGSVCKFTPDVAGVYWFEFCAYEGDSTAGRCDKWTVTVSEEPGPQPTTEFKITGWTKTGNNLVLTFEGEGAPVVLGTDSLASPQEWTPVDGAVVSGNTATVPMGAQNYIRIQ